MRSQSMPLRRKGWLLVVLGCVIAGSSPVARSQTPPLDSPVSPAAPASDQTAERLRALEELNRQLSERLERTTHEHDEQLRRLTERFETRSNAPSSRSAGEPPDTEGSWIGPVLFEQTMSDRAEDPESPVIDYTEGHFAPFTPAPGYPEMPDSSRGPLSLQPTFGSGFQFQTADESMRLQIHYESQIEGRVWGEQNQIPVNSGFFLPRQRIFFSGSITKSVEYELAINRGLNNINLLNAYLNFHFDDRFQIRAGRFFTPFNYDQYAVSNYWLLTPERSLFTTNLSLNRQIGTMAWGYLADKRIDYAAGVFNGSRNSFESVHNGVDVVGYVNVRPFQESEILSFARFLNVGSSVAFGRQDQPPVPATFRVGGGSPDANIPGIATVPFLILNPGVVERGDRLLGSVHAAYFFNSLSLIGEWQYGYGGYGTSSDRASERVPFAGYYVSGGYFLTGEHVERRTRVKPIQSLIPTHKDEDRGLGAWEVAGRVSRLSLGEEVFSDGFADANIWANSATTTELGMNWYWNEYLKWYMFWLHADFNKPVQYRPGEMQTNADMLWMRCQLYF